MRRIWAAWAIVFLTIPVGAVPKEETVPVEVLVEITEIDHSKATSLGVEWPDEMGWSLDPFVRVTDLQASLHLLLEEGAAEILANPNLLTDSGTAATFQAGGEIPYITNSSLGASNVEFKRYGVNVSIQPTVLRDGRIELKIKASISAPDQTNGVLLSGNAVPGLAEREVTSHVTVQPGTTITLAGLVQSHKNETTKGVPILRKIPLLGRLFRWKKTNLSRSTVVMFMTPTIKEF